MNDLERWKFFLAKMHIRFKVVIGYDIDEVFCESYRRDVLMIDYNGEYEDPEKYERWENIPSLSPALRVIFDTSGSFVRFDFDGPYRFAEYLQDAKRLGKDVRGDR